MRLFNHPWLKKEILGEKFLQVFGSADEKFEDYITKPKTTRCRSIQINATYR